MDEKTPLTEKTKKRWLALAAGLAATILIYFALTKAFSVSWEAVDQAWLSASKGLLLFTLIFSVVFHIIVGADKIYRVLRALKPLGFDLSWSEVLKLRLGTGPLRAFLPMDAGEVLIVLFYWRHKKIPFDLASGAAIFDKGLNLVGAVFWLATGLILLETHNVEFRITALLILGTGYVLFFFAVPLHSHVIRIFSRIHKKLGRFVSGVLTPLGHCTARQKLFFLAYGIIYRSRPLLVCYLLFLAFGVKPAPGPFLAFTSLALFAGHLPTAAGMGPREAVIMVSFANLAEPSTLLAIGFFQSLFVHVFPMLAGLPWVLWYLRRTALEGDHP